MAKFNRIGSEGLLSLPDANAVLNDEFNTPVFEHTPTELHVALPMNSKWKDLENVLSKVEGMLTPTEGRYLCQLARSKPGTGPSGIRFLIFAVKVRQESQGMRRIFPAYGFDRRHPR